MYPTSQVMRPAATDVMPPSGENSTDALPVPSLPPVALEKLKLLAAASDCHVPRVSPD